MPKGYWINHVEEIIDQDAFGRYITKWNALVDRGEEPPQAVLEDVHETRFPVAPGAVEDVHGALADLARDHQLEGRAHDDHRAGRRYGRRRLHCEAAQLE